MRLFEIEQKFRFDPSLIQIFRLNRGFPPFSSLEDRGTQRFSDTYFDREQILGRNGIWIRRRDGAWEAKRRISGTFIRSAFEEFKGHQQIRDLIGNFLTESRTGDRNFGLERICHFTTTRETFFADERFSIMLDRTDFGHTVGEVELMHSNAQEAHRAIDDFMNKYSWFFDRTKPKGKLSAYFEKGKQL
jgi:thiamine-triphosphatase